MPRSEEENRKEQNYLKYNLFRERLSCMRPLINQFNIGGSADTLNGSQAQYEAAMWMMK